MVVRCGGGMLGEAAGIVDRLGALLLSDRLLDANSKIELV